MQLAVGDRERVGGIERAHGKGHRPDEQDEPGKVRPRAPLRQRQHHARRERQRRDGNEAAAAAERGKEHEAARNRAGDGAEHVQRVEGPDAPRRIGRLRGPERQPDRKRESQQERGWQHGHQARDQNGGEIGIDAEPHDRRRERGRRRLQQRQRIERQHRGDGDGELDHCEYGEPGAAAA